MKHTRSAATRFKMIASAYPFFVRDGKILLSLRKNTGYADGMYSLPAGHVEDGETITDCLVREAKEEIGVTIESRHVSLVHVMHRKEEDTRMDFFFEVHAWTGEPVNREPDKCGGLLWCPIGALPDTMVPYIRAAIEQWQKGTIYSERGWPARNA